MKINYRVMKKALFILSVFVSLLACNNPNPGEGGAVNDGFQGAGDPNGGLPGDTVIRHGDSTVDSSTFGEDRVDTEKRDTVPH